MGQALRRMDVFSFSFSALSLYCVLHTSTSLALRRLAVRNVLEGPCRLCCALCVAFSVGICFSTTGRNVGLAPIRSFHRRVRLRLAPCQRC